jgi:hypothetical protein
VSDKYFQPERRPAVVTGASSGIGAATALSLAGAGFPVALGARRTDRCQEVAAQAREAGGEAVVQALDLTDASSVATIAEKVIAELGDIEVVISNAGAVAPGTIHEVDTERFARELDLNVVGAHRLVRAFVPGMVRAAPRRPGPRLVRRRGAGPAVHVVVRRRQVGSRGTGARDADGARGHRRARVDRAPRTDVERDGHGLGDRRGFAGAAWRGWSSSTASR